MLEQYKQFSPELGESVYVHESAVVIGQVKLADNVSVWPLTVIRGDVNYVEIGARSNIQDGSVLHLSRPYADSPEGFPLIIGEDVTVGHKVMLHGCTLGNRILVGMGAIIMDGAFVEDDVIVGAGSLVPPNKRLKSGWLYVGSPAKPIRELGKEERKFLTVSALNYVALANDYL